MSLKFNYRIVKFKYLFAVIVASITLYLLVNYSESDDDVNNLFVVSDQDEKLDRRHLIHMLWTSEPIKLPETAVLSIRSVCKQQPKALIKFWIIGTDRFDEDPPSFTCNVKFQWLDVDELFSDTPVNKDIFKPARRSKKYHFADSIRLALLYKHGGIYMDTDVIMLQPLTKFRNAIGFQDEDFINNALLIFDRNHPFLLFVMKQIPNYYDPKISNCIGPKLITDCAIAWWKLRPNHVARVDSLEQAEKVLPNNGTVYAYSTQIFYPIDYMFDMSKASREELHKKLKNAFTFHMWNSMLEGKQDAKKFLMDFVQEYV